MNEEKAARLAAIRAANATKAASTQPPAEPAPLEAVASPPDPTPAPRPTNPQPKPVRAVVAAGQGATELESSVTLSTLFTMLFAAIIGAFAAIVVLPRWLPGLSSSLLGPEPKAYWYLARSSAFVAFGLLWLAMALGISITSKAARIWPGGPTVFDLHQFTSLLALAFGLFHGLILLGDAFMSYTLAQILVPFGSRAFRPLWVGLGQIALYLLALVGLSFYVKSWIGRRAWRLVHFLSFAVFLLALAHGLGSGSDTDVPWIRTIYWLSAGSLVFMTLYRILITFTQPGKPAPTRQERARPSA